MFVHIIYPEQCPGESGGFAEGYQERGVDFSLRVDEYATEEKNKAAGRKDKRGDELEVNTHGSLKFFANLCRF